MWGNTTAGIEVRDGGNPTLQNLTIRDHSRTTQAGGGCGVLIYADVPSGKATIGAGCVFARNAGGDVVRRLPWRALLLGFLRRLRGRVRPAPEGV